MQPILNVTPYFKISLTLIPNSCNPNDFFLKIQPVTSCGICCLSAGAYLSPGFHYPVYGKMSGREETEKVNTSPSVNTKTTTESKALDLLQQHANQYRSKSPAVSLLLLLFKSTVFWGERGTSQRTVLKYKWFWNPAVISGCCFILIRKEWSVQK